MAPAESCTLAGADALLLELGTAYPEPGASAVDQADGGLTATHSRDLRKGARIHSGIAGVVDRARTPFLAGRTELVVGSRVQTAPDVRLSAPRYGCATTPPWAARWSTAS